MFKEIKQQRKYSINIKIIFIFSYIPNVEIFVVSILA